MKILFILALLISSSVAHAQPFYSVVTHGSDLSGGNGSDYFTITITGGDIHSVHVFGVDASDWTIYDDLNIFSPSWFANTNGQNGFSWIIGQDRNTAPGDYKFHVPFGQGPQVHLTSANIQVDLANGTWVPTSPPVPEPSTWLVMTLGFGWIGWSIRRLTSSAHSEAFRRRREIEVHPSGETPPIG